MKIYGMIHDVDLNNKIISIKKTNQVFFFYFQNGLMKLFKRYLYKGNMIALEYDESKIIVKNKRGAYLILFITNLYAPTKYKNKVYYDKKLLNESLKNFLNRIGNILFLDLEMTMPSFHHIGEFQSEIIQAGMLLVTNNNEIVEEKNFFVKPTKYKQINSRTFGFLNLDKNDYYKNSISYYDFYNEFKLILKKYRPTIMVYGKNDILFLERSYVINKVSSLNQNHRFVNLSQLIKNFYDLKSEPGLFKLYDFYYKESFVQTHDALEDSLITSKIFQAFKKDVNEEYVIGDELRSKLD